jgi:dTDP-4-dehydrorhamnose reductase
LNADRADLADIHGSILLDFAFGSLNPFDPLDSRSSLLRQMKILITGANGMVARATVEHCQNIGDEVFAFSRQELDIDKWEDVDKRLRGVKPDVVINCAAYTDVDGAETDREAAYTANADGVESLAFSCRNHNAVFVTISTDYVFNGEYDGFYTQRHTPDPQGVYALSKLDGEMRARKAYARSIIVRSGWIYGTGGKNFLSVMKDLLAEGRSIKAISDSFGTPTYAGDLAARLRELAELDLPCVFHAANSGPGTSFFGFAERLCEIAGYPTALVESISKDDLDRTAPRPASSKLACILSEKLGLSPMPDWEDALRRFVKVKSEKG